MPTTPHSSISSFSLYRAATATAHLMGVELRTLDAVPPAERSDGTPCHFEGRVQSMHDWCRRNENLVIRRGMREARIFAGFQRLSRALPIQKRYQRLAGVAREVSVFGIPDEPLTLTGARLVPLERGGLAREWFLLIDGPGYKALLVARDLDGFHGEVPLVDRRFDGFATHHPDIVRAMVSELTGRIARDPVAASGAA